MDSKSLRKMLAPRRQHCSTLLAVTLWVVLVSFCAPMSLASPLITGISPPLGRPGDILTINGSGFDSDPAKNVVRFGPNRAAVLTATPTQLIVQLPNGQPLGPAS